MLFEASYAVLALQMPPHAVGFFKRSPWPSETKKVLIEFYKSFRMGRQGVLYFFRFSAHPVDKNRV
jgi:hypothetical protein